MGKVDAQLGNTMSLISGTIKSIPTYWLPTITASIPPSLRITNTLIKKLTKPNRNHNLPIPNFIDNSEKHRLKSRNAQIRTV